MGYVLSIDKILKDFEIQITTKDKMTIEVFGALLVVRVTKAPFNASITVRLQIKDDGVVAADFTKEERNELIYQMLNEKYARLRIQQMLGITNTIIDSALTKIRK